MHCRQLFYYLVLTGLGTLLSAEGLVFLSPFGGIFAAGAGLRDEAGLYDGPDLWPDAGLETGTGLL